MSTAVEPRPQDADDRGITHPVNVAYLVVGLVLLGVAGTWALREAGVIDQQQTGWLLPLMLAGAGVVGLVAFAAKGLSRRRVRANASEPDDHSA